MIQWLKEDRNVFLSRVTVCDAHSRSAGCWVPQSHPGTWGPSIMFLCDPAGHWPWQLGHHWVTGTATFPLVGGGMEGMGWWENTP